MRQQLSTERTNYIISIVLAFSLFFSIVKNALVTCAGVIGTEFAIIVNISIYIILVVMVVLVIPKIMHSIFVIDVLAILLFLGAILFSWMQTTGYNDLFSDIFVNAIVAIGFFCVARSVDNYELVYGVIILFVPIATASFWLFFLVGSQDLGELYSQSVGYYALPIAVFSFSAFFSFDRKIYIKLAFCACFVSACFFMIASGARGPMICCLVYISIKIIQIDVVNRRIKAIAMILVALAFFGVYAFSLNSMLTALRAFLVSVGGSTRQIDSVINGTLFISEGRTDIAKYTIELINNHFLSGVGIGRDRILINKHFFYPREKLAGCYPHNFVLELLVQFGVIIGCALVLTFIIIIIIGFFSKADKYTKLLIQAYFGIGFLPLMFSGSYINQGQFFVLIALCCNVIADSKHIQNRLLIR